MIKRLAPFILCALAVLFVPLPASAQPTERTVTLDLSQFEFAPGRLEVNQGDTVIITLKASDVVHGFYLDGYGIEQRVEPGIAQQVTFTADQPGKFRYRCSVSCGSLHPFMIGELIVGTNVPYWRAIGFVAVALAGMLVYLWQRQSITGVNRESTQAV
ncbi:MAG: cupredoxin domain-containing protein [Anaerolineae bacterium]|nr:cupredoxin domain-containing protein [Anaerolineae bacterium]